MGLIKLNQTIHLLSR